MIKYVNVTCQPRKLSFSAPASLLPLFTLQIPLFCSLSSSYPILLPNMLKEKGEPYKKQ